MLFVGMNVWGQITNFPFTASFDDGTTAPFDENATIVTSNSNIGNVLNVTAGRGQTVTSYAYFDSNTSEEGNQPYSIGSNEKITMTFVMYNGWYNYTCGTTFSLFNSAGKTLVSFFYEPNGGNKLANLKIGDSAPEGFSEQPLRSRANTSQDANGFTSRPYVTTASYNTQVTITLTGTGLVTFRCVNGYRNVDVTYSAELDYTMDLSSISISNTGQDHSGFDSSDRTSAFDNFNIKSEVLVTYKYVDTNDNDLSDIVADKTEYVTVGTSISDLADAADQSTFYSSDTNTKYVFSTYSCTDETVQASGSTIKMKFTPYAKYTWTVNAVDAEDNYLTTISTGSEYADVAASKTISWKKGQYINNTWYLADAQTSTPHYSHTFSSTETVKVVCRPSDIVYFAEAEDIASGLHSQTPIGDYASNGFAKFFEGNKDGKVSTSMGLAAGKYDVIVAAFDRQSKKQSYDLYRKTSGGVETLIGAMESNRNDGVKITTFENVSFEANEELCTQSWTNTYNSSFTLDYIYVKKSVVTYTVKYMCGDIEIKTADASRTAIWGTTVALTNADKSNITYDNKNYRYTSDNASTQTIASDGSTVITVNFEEMSTVATPTFTIGSYDYEQGGYAITPACTTEGATLTYTIGGGAATECTNGVPFYAVNGALVVTASKTNWISSSSESATLNSAPAATSPESLIPFSSSTDNYDKNQMHTYKSVSIPGDNFAGINSGTGLKLRTGKTTSIENVTGLQLNVIEGYKVTKVAFSNAYSNNSSTISVNSVYVDGTQLSNFEAKELPATGSTTAFDIDGISATQSIVIGMGTEATQYRATITVTYEKNSVDATIGTYGYATFSSTYALDFTNVENATAFIVTSKNNDGTAIVMQPVTGKIAAGTGLILKGTEGSVTNVTIPITSETGTYYNTTSDIKNYLFPINTDDYELKAATNGGTNYILTVQSEKVVFAPIGDISAIMNAGQAALWLPASTPARTLILSFDEEEITAINGISSNEPKASKNYYNLQGQRVSQPKQGIYVVEGKKVLVK